MDPIEPIELLKLVYAAMIYNDNSPDHNHPWIPGGPAKILKEEIRKTLGITTPQDEAALVRPYAHKIAEGAIAALRKWDAERSKREWQEAADIIASRTVGPMV